MKEFPEKILFLSDDTEAVFVNEITGPKIKERTANYKYTKAIVSNGFVFPLFLDQIERLQESKLIICH